MKKTIYKLLFAFMMSCMLQLAYAQQRTVTGTVTDDQGEPIANVSFVVKGTTTGGITSGDGSFITTVNGNDAVLVFSSVGYASREVPVGNNSTLNVTLTRSETQGMDEVVVTALGIKRQKRSLGYSTQTINGGDIVQSSAPNIINALSGNVAGAQVVQPNGVDGGTTKIILRGNNSLNFSANNQPLIIVDGMPLENEPGMTSATSGKDWGSAINNINPNDIESMDVLKGPPAAALYGARGANGVIMITLKKGSKKGGLGIDYNFETKLIQPWLYRDVQNTYGGGGAINDLEPTLRTNGAGDYVLPSFWVTGMLGATNNPILQGGASWDRFSWYGPGASWGPKMEGQDVVWWDGVKRKYSPQPDNLKSFYRNGKTNTHNLAFNAGGDFGSVRVSLTRTDHTSVDYNSGYDQTTANIGANLNISKKIKALVSMSYINYNRLNATELGESDRRQTTGRMSSGKYLLYNWGRDYQPIDKYIYQNVDGTQNQFWSKPPGADYTGFNDYEGYGYFYDYWWRLHNNNEYLKRNKILGTVGLTYDITSWLALKGNLSTDMTFNEREQKNKPTDITGITNGLYNHGTGSGKALNADFMLTAHKDELFKDISASATIGGVYWGRNDYFQSMQTNDWQYPWAYTISNIKSTSRITTTENQYKKKIRSTIGILDFGYKNWLFLNLTGRNDISSTLPRATNSYFFPSANMSFVFTDAIPSLKENNVLS
ncbi:MAG: TonB-dependent receptor plug domain-containing protein, partial [Niabella sp.]